MKGVSERRGEPVGAPPSRVSPPLPAAPPASARSRDGADARAGRSAGPARTPGPSRPARSAWASSTLFVSSAAPFRSLLVSGEKWREMHGRYANVLY